MNVSTSTVAATRITAQWVKRPALAYRGGVYYQCATGILHAGPPPGVDPATVFSSSSFVFNAPLKAYFDFTNRCNLKCLHCITSSSPHTDTSNDLSTPRILALMTELAEVGVLEMGVAGGEPLIHPDWPAILSHITATGMNLILTTNGLRLTPAVVRTLVQIKPLEIRVSFDGGPILHEAIRGPNTYARALTAISRVVESGLKATARLTLCRDAEDELPRLFGDLARSGVETVRIAIIKAAGRAATLAGAPFLRDEMPDQRLSSWLLDLGRAYGLTPQLSVDDFPVSIQAAHDPKLRDQESPNCGAGFETCYISPQGALLSCVTLPELEMGQLHTRSFMTVWQDKIADDFRRAALATNERRLCDALGGCKVHRAVGGKDGVAIPLLPA